MRVTFAVRTFVLILLNQLLLLLICFARYVRYHFTFLFFCIPASPVTQIAPINTICTNDVDCGRLQTTIPLTCQSNICCTHLYANTFTFIMISQVQITFICYHIYFYSK